MAATGALAVKAGAAATAMYASAGVSLAVVLGPRLWWAWRLWVQPLWPQASTTGRWPQWMPPRADVQTR